MIYLFGGPPRCGKTTLAEAIAKKKSVPYFSLDHVTSAITPYIPEKDFSERLPLRVALKETGYSNDTFYSKYSTNEILDIYLCQAKTLWPGVKGFIEYAVHDGHNLILEGWQLLPHLIKTIVNSENAGVLKIIFLVKTDVNSIVKGLTIDPEKIDWVKKNTKCEETFYSIGQMISQFGSYIQEAAATNGFQAVNTENDFISEVKKIVESL